MDFLKLISSWLAVVSGQAAVLVNMGPASDIGGGGLISIEYNLAFSEIYMVRPHLNLEVYDLNFSHKRTIALVGSPHAPGNLHASHEYVIRDPDSGDFFITNKSAETVDRFSSTGQFQNSINTGSVKGIAYRPDTETLLTVSYPGVPTVFEYSLQGALLQSIPIPGHSPSAVGLAYDSEFSRIFLGSNNNNVLESYDLSGAHIETVIPEGGEDYVDPGYLLEGMSYVEGDVDQLFWTGMGNQGDQLVYAFDVAPVPEPRLGVLCSLLCCFFVIIRKRSCQA